MTPPVVETPEALIEPVEIAFDVTVPAKLPLPDEVILPTPSDPVMVALLAWGNRHFAEEGIAIDLVDAATGIPAEPVLVDRKSGREINQQEFAFGPGPAASERTRRRMKLAHRGHPLPDQQG